MSSKRIIGSAAILGNLAIGGKYAMRTFNGTAPDANTGIVDYPIYKRSEVQKILDMLPISRIGEMDYLPLNVNGSYEGATSLSDVYRMQPTIVEDDGTGVVLRAGTNGSTEGYYYAFIRDLRNIDALTQSSVISTTSKYHPRILPSTENVKQFIGTNGYELLVSLSSASNYIFTLTNGTFNEVAHIHASIAATSFGTDKPLYAHIVNDKVFVWCKDTTIANYGLALTLYTVNTSSIKDGTMSTFVKVTGFSGQTLRSVNYTSANNLKIYERLYSVGTSSDSLFECTSPVTRVEYSDYTDYNIQANVSPDLSKIRITLFPTNRLVSNLYISTVYASGFSFVYTINSKSLSIDGSSRAPIAAEYNDVDGFTLTNPFAIEMNNFMGTQLGVPQLGNVGSICQTYDGLVFSTRARWSSSETYGIQVYNVTGTPYDSWVASTRKANNSKFVNVAPTYGSAVGENLLGTRFIDKRKVLLACSGTYEDESYGYNNTVFSEIGTDPTFQFNSVQNNTTLNGFAPQANRTRLGDDFKYTGMISLIDTDGSVKCYGTSFIEGVYKTSGGLFNPDTLEFDGSYTIGDNVLETLKQEILANIGIVGAFSGKIALYYVPDSSFSKSIAVVSAYNLGNNQGYAIYSEVDVTVSGTNISSASMVSSRYETLNSVTGIVTEAYMKRCTGLTVAKYSGFGYIGVDAVHQFSQPGNAQFKLMIAKTVNGLITSNRFMSSSYIDNGNAFQHGVIPGVGFGYYHLQDSDYQTKAVFSLFGTTSAQMDGLIDGSGTVQDKIVVVSQDVAEGFTVYFTREVPVFLGGMFDRLAIQTIELSTIKTNPANSTFYLYIQMNRNTRKAAYVISTTLLDETLTNVYVGDIVTGSTSITSIDTEKVTRFLTYRPSTTKRGSAIPASTGVPSSSGTRWH